MREPNDANAEARPRDRRNDALPSPLLTLCPSSERTTEPGLCLLFFVAEELASTEDCRRDADEHDDLLHGIPPDCNALTQREPSPSYDIPQPPLSGKSRRNDGTTEIDRNRRRDFPRSRGTVGASHASPSSSQLPRRHSTRNRHRSGDTRSQRHNGSLSLFAVDACRMM